ncbi:ROP-interactive CRIB motif-containing protein 10 [Tripterygium wilfordii]|uniref:ROP-interactive CRIB motif-containing protein 10 n=2 Tax=Tripterygium wilfordii TaxID=458696 RepID=A0A7J7C4H7_TRIWF|nr:CRIB domain-containing protein RIC10-like isoform X2 [Tripterygium wilfordii]XP_038690845.1 CRIB domain-containing protein RIC10-like isoform X2 [Tripterygium wilfordii]XP_038690846.1 CRIB domain-containing protein RIC10-like isoform X2 [Tripterygium wilfordii]XP_038690847.1 CRIB domain-containing protein RIC10-like isoform X2 [Tripterygium wilfordii]KAF5729022.1 ROP-interactive CRIB motif-containing protein 10 [Tripterygium wilfordii]
MPAMGTKIKGICKGFKFISQIFVVKDREMEIGYPTDVKHVAHIGWDDPSGSAPSWMNDFKSAPDFSTSIGNQKESNPAAISSWSSQDFDQAGRRQSYMFQDIPTTDIPNVPKKQKRTKKSTSSPKSSSSSSRSSRVPKSKSTLHELEPTRNLHV